MQWQSTEQTPSKSTNQPPPRVHEAQGPAFLLPLVYQSHGWTKTQAPEHAHKPFSGDRGLILTVFTHNRCLIKFDFSSHLFSGTVPFEVASGDRLAVGGANRAEPFHPTYFQRMGLGQASALRMFLSEGHCPQRLASPGIPTAPRSQGR